MSIDAELQEMRARLKEQEGSKDDPKLGHHYKLTQGRISQLENRKAQQQKIDLENAQSRGELVEADAQRGIEFAKNTLGMGEGSLGRMDTSRFEDLSKGMSAEELQANRDKALENINRSTQTQNRQLQSIQQRQGIRGATAGSQQLSILSGGEDRKANFERDLFLQDRSARVEGLNNLAEVQRFNLAQAAQEKYDLAQFGLAMSQIGMQERGAEKARQAQLAAAALSRPRCFTSSMKVQLNDGTFKRFDKLAVGDELLVGGKIYNLMSYIVNEPIYDYFGVEVTGEHAVYHNFRWMRVKDIPGIEKAANQSNVVWNLCCETHRIIIEAENGIAIFSDYVENDDLTLTNEQCLAALNNERI